MTVDDRPETNTFTGADGVFHISELRKKYWIEFMEPGGVLGYCPPVGDVYWQICVSHPAYKDFNQRIDDQMDLARSPTNPGPYNKKIPLIVLRPISLRPTR